MAWIERLLTPFSVPRNEADLAIAQVTALARQVPVLHATLVVNAVAVAYTHYGIAPDGLTILPLGVLIAICIARLLKWKRRSGKTVDGDEAARLLRGTNWLAAILGSGFAGWAMLLMRYGDIGTKMHVLFFLTITMIACIFCLTHLRSAAAIISLIAAPLTIYFVTTQPTVLRVTALNYAAVVCVMSFMQAICYRDFCRLVRLGAENREMALTDMLTGLPNRRSFFARLQATIERADTGGDRFVVAMIDLDGFKPVNDTFGHQAGDAVLCEVGRRLERAVAGIGWAARLGGDEFGLIVDGEPDLERFGKALCAALRAPYTMREATARIGASVGFARFPESANSAEILLERADYALYHAKAFQRGGAVSFTEEHEARLRSHAIVEQALRRADFEVEFALHFQPIVDAVEVRVEAYEALARWKSPKLGPVSPADFIAVAERSGLIQDLTQVLLRKALTAMRTWPEDVRLSFNLSGHDIASAEGLARITDLIVASGIAPNRIIFEVTETSLMHDLVDARRSLLALKALGVGIALDDFGTGYSSLSYVHQLPIDKLKIDRSFVTAIGEDAASLNIVRSIVDLCRNLGIVCVVEGVETTGQLLALRSVGCRFMQGYLFQKPMPQAEIAAFHAAPLRVRDPDAASGVLLAVAA